MTIDVLLALIWLAAVMYWASSTSAFVSLEVMHGD